MKKLNLTEATILALEGKHIEVNNTDELIKHIDDIYNDIYTKLIGIVDSSYEKLKELKEPEKCKTLDMYYGSSAVYNIQENKLEICDHDEQYISPPGLISGNKLFLYGIKIGGAYLYDKNYGYTDFCKNVINSLKYSMNNKIKPLVNEYNNLIKSFNNVDNDKNYDLQIPKYNFLNYLITNESRKGYFYYGVCIDV